VVGDFWRTTVSLLADGTSMTTGATNEKLFERDREQIRRSRLLLAAGDREPDLDRWFVFHVAALHVARAIPEYWYTMADVIPERLRSAERETLRRDLRVQIEERFCRTSAIPDAD
jgi:hypothetical protein